MSEKRRDNRNRILREVEYQRKDGRYRFRPHLPDIGSGSGFVLQNVNLRLLRVHPVSYTHLPEGGKVGTEGHKSPGQYGFSEDGLRAPGACQQSAFLFCR